MQITRIYISSFIKINLHDMNSVNGHNEFHSWRYSAPYWHFVNSKIVRRFINEPIFFTCVYTLKQTNHSNILKIDLFANHH